MRQKSIVLLGGSDEVNGDYSLLRKLAESKRTFHRGWSCTKETRRGDELWVYISAPISAIVAVAEAASDAVPGKRWPYEVSVCKVRWIDNHITMDELKKMFPRWPWPRYARGKAYLNSRQVTALRKRSLLKAKPNGSLTRTNGAGFGNLEQNRLTEKAAIRFVRRLYQRRGYSVTSCESENLGYDLCANNGRRELHLEVKGVGGSEPYFIITRNELKCARSDPLFRAVIVTRALDRKPKLHEMTGSAFIARYIFTTISYIAKPKS